MNDLLIVEVGGAICVDRTVDGVVADDAGNVAKIMLLLAAHFF